MVTLSAIFWVVQLICCEELLTPQDIENDSLYLEKNFTTPQRRPRSNRLKPSSQQTSSSCQTEEFQHSKKCGIHYPANIAECLDGNISLTPCYCLSEDYLLGYCQFTCFQKSFLIANITTLVEEECSHFNRRGKFCGQCNNNTAYAAYSFSLKCVPCKGSWKNVVKYVAVAYGPLSVFLLLIMAFSVSVNSAPLLGFIFVAQIATMPFQMRIGAGMIEGGHIDQYQAVGVRILGTIYGIWNLDFFRSVIPLFCIHPHLTTIHVMCLDYIIASYPCVLILLTYTTVEFYSRGYRICCWWRPFHRCFARLKNEMNIKTTLVDAFGTIFSLSYSKTLNTTFDILAITPTWNRHGNREGYSSYYAAADKIDPLIVTLGVSFFLIFNVLPIICLFLYSLKQPPQQGNPNGVSGFFRPLLNTLLASYRDGSDGGLNCRFFCIVYLTARVVIYGALMLTPNIFLQLVAAVILLTTGMLVAVIRPYKSNAYNTVDIVLMLSLALSYIGIASYYFAHFISPASISIAEFFGAVVCNIPAFYITLLMLYYIVKVSRVPQRAIVKISEVMSNIKTLVRCAIRRLQRRPRVECPANIRSTSTMYVAIESDTIRVSNIDLCQ